MFAAASFGQKLGGALAGALIGFVLSYMGYAANEAQSGSSLLGIRLLMSVIPAAFALLAVLAVRAYPLSEANLVQIRQELAQRR